MTRPRSNSFSNSFGSALLLGAAALGFTNCGRLPDDGAAGALAAAAVKDASGITITLAASGNAPVDSAPDKQGNTFFFTGADQGGSGVFRVQAKGNQDAKRVRTGAPFVSPESLVAACQGDRLYVADPGADSIFAIGAHSGRIEATLAAGNSPRGVEIAGACAPDPLLYFTGRDTTTGAPGLFRLDAEERTVAVATGAPFANPSAVAVGSDGVAYVSDTPGVAGAGRIIVVENGAASVLAQGLNLGQPAGVSLTLDGKTLLVSGLDGGGHGQVYVIDTGTGAITTFTGGGIEGSTAAGGLHRAAQRNVFSWADRSRGGNIFNIGLSVGAYNE